MGVLLFDLRGIHLSAFKLTADETAAMGENGRPQRMSPLNPRSRRFSGHSHVGDSGFAAFRIHERKC
jgi:hypothetical protein